MLLNTDIVVLGSWRVMEDDLKEENWKRGR